MNEQQKDKKILDDIMRRQGREFILKEINKINQPGLELTIISNSGMHPLPQEYIKGECFIASEGNLNFTNKETVQAELDLIVSNLKKKLFEKKWTKIYLVPFGHSVLSITIKMAVFRALRIETIDLFYFGENRYDFIERDSRESLLRAE